MTTKSVGRSFKIIDGKVQRVTPFRAKIKKHKADRLVKAWAKKSRG